MRPRQYKGRRLACGDGERNVRASFERVLATREPVPMALQRYDMIGRDGRFVERYWSPLISPVMSPDGEIAYHLIKPLDHDALLSLLVAAGNGHA